MSGKNRGQRISRYEQDSDKSDSDARGTILSSPSHHHHPHLPMLFVLIAFSSPSFLIVCNFILYDIFFHLGNTDVSLGDVSVGVPNSSAAASIITQVDRNGKTNQPQQRNEDDEETEYKPNSGNGRGRRTFAQRLLCCFGRPASGTARRRGDGQISLVANTERKYVVR